MTARKQPHGTAVMTSSGTRTFCLVRVAVVAAVLATTLLGPAVQGVAAASLSDRAAAWRSRDADRIVRAIPSLARLAAQPVFDSMRDRVDGYTDWVYGWIPSLVTSVELGGVAATEIGNQLATSGTIDPGPVDDALVAYVDRRFDALVVQREYSRDRLRQARARVLRWTAELDARLAEDRRRRIVAAARAAGQPAAPVLAVHGQAFLGDTGQWNGTGPARAPLPPPEAGEDADVVLTRSIRPFATRILSWSARLAVIPLAGGAAVIPSMEATAGASGLVLTSAVIAAVWAADYAVNWVDAAWNRDAVAADVIDVIEQARSRAERDLASAVATTLCRHSGAEPFCAAAAQVARTTPVN